MGEKMTLRRKKSGPRESKRAASKIPNPKSPIQNPQSKKRPLLLHAAKVWTRLRKHWPAPRCELHYGNPLELLVAVILSAQCTDARVNLATKGLFRKYKTARDYAEAGLPTLEKEIYSTGFYRNKARHIAGACRLIAEKHGGRVPDSMESLLELPGVARKTANVILGTAFRKAEGIVVDTHVTRVSRRLGLTKEKEPPKIEQALMRLFARERWIDLGHAIVLHGRYVCAARKPRCSDCRLNDICPSSEVKHG